MERDYNGNWFDIDLSEEDENILELLEEFGY